MRSVRPVASSWMTPRWAASPRPGNCQPRQRPGAKRSEDDQESRPRRSASARTAPLAINSPAPPSDGRRASRWRLCPAAPIRPAPAHRRAFSIFPRVPRRARHGDGAGRYAGQRGPRARSTCSRARSATRPRGVRRLLRHRLAAGLAGRRDPVVQAHRVADDGGDGTPDPLGPQVPIIEAVLDAIGLARCGVADFEADDVIGTYADAWHGPVDVVTGDRDLFQLIRDDKPVRVIYSVEKYAAIDEAAVDAQVRDPGARLRRVRGPARRPVRRAAGRGRGRRQDRRGAGEHVRHGRADAARRWTPVSDAGFPAGARTKLSAPATTSTPPATWSAFVPTSRCPS